MLARQSTNHVIAQGIEQRKISVGTAECGEARVSGAGGTPNVERVRRSGPVQREEEEEE
jgi:hypothetical protein